MRASAMIAAVLALTACRRSEAPAAPSEAPAPAESRLVYFKDLMAYLPRDLPGYQLAFDEGSTGKYGSLAISEAERAFAKNGREVRFHIVDGTQTPALAKRIRAAVRDNSGKDEADPTAPLLLGDAMGYVRFDPEEATAEANILVSGDRFVVAVTTRGFDNTVEVRRAARELDLAGLAKLR